MKRFGILLVLAAILTGCGGGRLVLVGDSKKGPIWVPIASPTEEEIKKLADPEELQRFEEEAQKRFPAPKTPECAQYLCRHVRKALAGKDIDPANFYKHAPGELLQAYDGWVFVSAYGKKAKLFKAAAKGKNAAEAAFEAIQKLTSETRGKLLADVDSLPVKIDFLETLLAVETPRAALQVFVPGIDGLMLLPESVGEYRLPSQIMKISPATSTDIALYFSILPKTDTLRRFHTRAFLQTKAGEKPVALTRSLPPVPGVTADLLKKRIAAACEYLVRNQRDNGSYAYLYAANRDRFLKVDEESMVRHVGSVAYMALAGEVLGRKDFLDSAAKCLDFVQAHVRRENGLAYLLKRGEGTLGGSALLAWALSHYRRATGSKKCDQLAREAADFILMLQKPDGTFYNFYDPVGKKPVDRPIRFYQGEACLGLAWYYKVYGGKKYLDAALRAATVHAGRRKDLLDKGSASLDAWLMQAARFLYPLAEEKQKKAMLPAVEKMAQIMVEAQRDEKTASHPDLAGSFRSGTQSLPAGPGTAAMCEGLAGACLLLKSLNKPVEKIVTTLLNAAAFQLKHQFWDKDMYFLPNPDRARGGIKGTLIDNQVRIDHVQHTVGIWLQLLQILEQR